MTKVLGRQHCCAHAAVSLQLIHGTENLLDGFYRARSAGGLSAADLVGSGRDRSYPFRLMVGGLPQRLVLSGGRGRGGGRRA